MSGKKYVEVGAVLEFADVFFADPILRAATRAILAAAPAAVPIEERETRGTEKDCLTKMLMESPSLCTLYGTPENYAEDADWLLDEGVAVPCRYGARTAPNGAGCRLATCAAGGARPLRA